MAEFSAEAQTRKVLVAYFSVSGNTGKVAWEIQRQTGGDIFRIETVTPYPNDSEAVIWQRQEEQKTDYRLKIATKADNIKNYNTIILGSPVWWYGFAPPIKIFLDQYDLSDKKEAVFTTYGGGSGERDETVTDFSKPATLLESFAIQEDKIRNAEDTINEWLKKIGLISLQKQHSSLYKNV
jgi:flavodoxin